jgi:site-specific DNA-methyltransferase (adenine-specific)
VIEPYLVDGDVTLYHGKMEEVIPALGLTADLVLADPPYAETSLAWDSWLDGWPNIASIVASSMWCFGSMRMFLDRRDEFAGWKLSQDVVWDKGNGSSFVADRFKRVHEHALHWYQGAWAEIHKAPPREQVEQRYQAPQKAVRANRHQLGRSADGVWVDDGTRLLRSILARASLWHSPTRLHPTEKPVGILTPLIEYACPPGGTVLDPFAGSGSTGEACRLSGRRAVLIEGHEPYCEAIARRLAQRDLFADLLGGAS